MAESRAVGGSGPTGTVSFLFTDVEGSTRLWQERPEEMAIALGRHDTVLRAEITRHRGRVFSTAGDSFAAAFWTPHDAVAAALAAQAALAEANWPRSVDIRVRMAVHTGTATERDGDYFGPTLNRTARIMDAGHGGQILMSDATARLLGTADFRDLGEHRLKDLSDMERIWQVNGGEFPPLRLGRQRRGNLPTARRSFVGRVGDRTRLAADVQPGQVVTLTGVGGVGKTRLALETARDLSHAYGGDVWWCDLAPIEDPGGLAVAVASMLSINLQPDMSPVAAVVDALRGRQALLVFDNCEHVLDPVASLIDGVVSNCPMVAVLATSREPLSIGSERIWPVRPLDPDLEGVELFVDRAVAADATFVADEDRSELVELCRHLDGLPLAIELAAARVRAMSPAELLDRLHDRFRLLRGGARGGMDRHRTLAATLDWSYSLLLPEEKRLLDRLGVFAGSFDVNAVDHICTDDVVDATLSIDVLASLVDKSMVIADRRRAGTRYRLLETVRQYSEAHAIDNAELVGLRDRHLAHYMTLADTAFAAWLDDYTSARQVFEDEWDNLRAAVQHALTLRDSATLDRLFAALSWPASYTLAYEVGDWAQQATILPGAGASTFGTAATMAAIIGRFDEGEQLAETGIAVADTPLAPTTWMCWTALVQGRGRAGWTPPAYEAVLAAHQTASEGIGDWGDGYFSAMRCIWEVRNDPAAAEQLAQHALAIASAKHNPQLSADVLTFVGIHYAQTGDPARGLELCREGLALTEAHQLRRSNAGVRNSLAQVAMLGALEDPTPALRDGITNAHRERLWYDLWPTVRSLARWWATHGQRDAAAVVVGHLDAHGLSGSHHQTLNILRSDSALDQCRARGAMLDREALVRYVLEELGTSAE